MSKAEADSERSSRTDPDQMKDTVRRGGSRRFECFFRILRYVADSAGHVDSNEVPIALGLELSLVSLFIDPFTSVSNLLR